MKIKDIGVSALGHGYGQLQSIDLTGYIRRTTIGLSALGHIVHKKYSGRVVGVIRSIEGDAARGGKEYGVLCNCLTLQICYF